MPPEKPSSTLCGTTERLLASKVSDSLSRINSGRLLTGSSSEWDALTEQGTYLVSNCPDVPGGAYGYGILIVFAVPTSVYGRVQIYVPDSAAPRLFFRARYNNAVSWKAWGSVQTAAL